ncbi:hypothetical protein ACFQPG_08185 [Sphingomonas sp. GCM10030256]|uniref:hypothetical protein n=1 Tax=Sphingomonas sp. GCM10030256 TaxID=3273427 RepID=UPI0036060FE7
MRWLAGATAGVPALALAQTPAAPDGRAGTNISVIAGECRSLVVANRVLTKACTPNMIGILYPDREISFVFGLADGSLISFKGRPGHAQGQQTTLKVVQVTVSSKNVARPAAVLGSCVFTGLGSRRNHLQCDVSGEGLRYSASFVTRGSVPARFTL